MQAPIGPSLHLALLLTEALAEVSVRVLDEAWTRWLGPERYRRKLEQFVRRGWAETITASPNTERIVRLTGAGRLAALGGRDPETCWGRPWDGRWRLVLFDVPETQLALRNRLRRKLRTLGFGYLQNSAWITPDRIETLRVAMGAAAGDVETLSFMEARPCEGETDAELVLGAWDFPRIARNYALYGAILADPPTRASSRRSWQSWLGTECRAWAHAVRSDPLLPEALLPKNYRGRETLRRRREVLRRALHLR